MRRILPCFAVLTLIITNHAVAETLTDGFDDGFIDPADWNCFLVSGSGSATEADGVLQTGIDWGMPNSLLFAELQREIVGDFDISISYEWLTNYHIDYARGGLRLNDAASGDIVSNLYLRNSSEGDWFFFNAGDHEALFKGAPLTGMLRLERAGTAITGYFGEPGDWRVVGGWNIATDDVTLSLFVDNGRSGPSNPTNYPEVRVNWDNLRVEAAQIVPEPSCTALLSTAILGLLAMSRCRRTL